MFEKTGSVSPPSPKRKAQARSEKTPKNELKTMATEFPQRLSQWRISIGANGVHAPVTEKFSFEFFINNK